MTTHSQDAWPRLVADRRRREILRQLRDDSAGETTIDELVDGLLGEEASSDIERSERLAIELYHAHLPMLEDHGVVDFDPERETVRYRPDERIEGMLNSFADEKARTNR